MKTTVFGEKTLQEITERRVVLRRGKLRRGKLWCLSDDQKEGLKREKRQADAAGRDGTATVLERSETASELNGAE